MATPNSKRDHVARPGPTAAVDDVVLARRDLLRIGGMSLIVVTEPLARDKQKEIIWIGHRNRRLGGK